jgi:hypothetical protein
MSNILRFTHEMNELDTVKVWNDFIDDQSDIYAVDTITDTGTVLMGDDVNGIATLTPSDGTVADNDEAYIATPNEWLKFGTNREIYIRHKFSYTAVVAADPNWAVGAQNAVAANSIVDNGGVKTSGSTLAIEKKDGETKFRCTTACNGTAVTTLSNLTMAAATNYVTEIICKDHDGTNMWATFKVNGDYLNDANGVRIRHEVPIASATEMSLFAGIKLGAATNNDTLLLDYWYAATNRV